MSPESVMLSNHLILCHPLLLLLSILWYGRVEQIIFSEGFEFLACDRYYLRSFIILNYLVLTAMRIISEINTIIIPFFPKRKCSYQQQGICPSCTVLGGEELNSVFLHSLYSHQLWDQAASDRRLTQSKNKQTFLHNQPGNLNFFLWDQFHEQGQGLRRPV